MIATFVKQASKMQGQAQVYDVDPPIKSYDGDEHSTVVVSSVSGMYATECFIFPWSKEDDEVSDWGELDGSRRGVIMPAQLLAELGYEVVYPDMED